MKYSQAKAGRIFVLRLEDGEIVHETLETFAADHGIQAASLIILGGADKESRLIVGPEEGRSEKIVPMQHSLEDVYEVAGTGTIFPNAQGEPVLHMHMALGRAGRAKAGCVRAGVRVWHVMEVILQELVGTPAVRKLDAATGFELLEL